MIATPAICLTSSISSLSMVSPFTLLFVVIHSLIYTMIQNIFSLQARKYGTLIWKSNPLRLHHEIMRLHVSGSDRSFQSFAALPIVAASLQNIGTKHVLVRQTSVHHVASKVHASLCQVCQVQSSMFRIWLSSIYACHDACFDQHRCRSRSGLLNPSSFLLTIIPA